MNAVRRRRGDGCPDVPLPSERTESHPPSLDPHRYDYLEFTDSRGGKVRYDMKVGTEKWPKVGNGSQHFLPFLSVPHTSSLAFVEGDLRHGPPASVPLPFR